MTDENRRDVTRFGQSFLIETFKWSFSGDRLMFSDQYGYESILLSVDELTNSRLVISLEGEELVLRKD